MEENFKDIIADFIDNILFECLEGNGFKILVRNKVDDWEFELPNVLKSEVLLLELSGWSLKNSYISEDGVFIQLAFGENENSVTVAYNDIIQILSLDGTVYYIKTSEFENPTQKQEKIYKQIPNGKGVTYSMSKMMIKNNKLFGKLKKD